MTDTPTDPIDQALLYASLGFHEGPDARSLGSPYLWRGRAPVTLLSAPVTAAISVLRDARLGLRADTLVCSDYAGHQLDTSPPLVALTGFATGGPIRPVLSSFVGLKVVRIPSPLWWDTPFEDSALVLDSTKLTDRIAGNPFIANHLAAVWIKGVA